MTADDSRFDMVVVAHPGSLMEADMIRAALGAAGILAVIPGEFATNTLSHLAGGLNPTGMKVLVPGLAAKEARVVVEQWCGRQGTAEVDVSCDAWARRAWHAAWLELMLPMMIPVAAYCILKARHAAKHTAPVDEARYRRDLRQASVLVSVAVICASVILVGGLLEIARSYTLSQLLDLGSLLFGLLAPLI